MEQHTAQEDHEYCSAEIADSLKLRLRAEPTGIDVSNSLKESEVLLPTGSSKIAKIQNQPLLTTLLGRQGQPGWARGQICLCDAWRGDSGGGATEQQSHDCRSDRPVRT